MSESGAQRMIRAIMEGESDPVTLWHLLDSDNRQLHVIPVPEGQSIEQAWEGISRGDDLPEPPQGWAVVEIKDGRLIRVRGPE